MSIKVTKQAREYAAITDHAEALILLTMAETVPTMAHIVPVRVVARGFFQSRCPGWSEPSARRFLAGALHAPQLASPPLIYV
jgi:hypothetical protein